LRVAGDREQESIADDVKELEERILEEANGTFGLEDLNGSRHPRRPSRRICQSSPSSSLGFLFGVSLAKKRN
jgi:hypothetical protein